MIPMNGYKICLVSGDIKILAPGGGLSMLMLKQHIYNEFLINIILTKFKVIIKYLSIKKRKTLKLKKIGGCLNIKI